MCSLRQISTTPCASTGGLSETKNVRITKLSTVPSEVAHCNRSVTTSYLADLWNTFVVINRPILRCIYNFWFCTVPFLSSLSSYFLRHDKVSTRLISAKLSCTATRHRILVSLHDLHVCIRSECNRMSELVIPPHTTMPICTRNCVGIGCRRSVQSTGEELELESLT